MVAEKNQDADFATRQPSRVQSATVGDRAAAAASQHVQTRFHISYTITGHMFGNGPMRGVAAQNRDTTTLVDDANMNIVENPIQQAQAIIVGILDPAASAAAFTSTKQEF